MFISRTVAALRGHAFRLARASGKKIVEDPGMPIDHATAVGGRIAMVPPIDSEETYAAALHELGHCIAPRGHGLCREPTSLVDVGLQFHLRLEEEHNAWDWAEAAALRFGPWTAAMESVRRGALETYHVVHIDAQERAYVIKHLGRVKATESVADFMKRRS